MVPDLITVIGIIIIAGCNYFATGLFIKYAKENNITDIPTERSSHSTPTPRGGGIGFVFTSIIAFIIYFAWQDLLIYSTYLFFVITTTVVASLGWFDDRNDLSQTIRFTIQVTVAGLILFFVGGLDRFSLPYVPEFSLGFFSPFLGILWIVGVTNIYNFMDGIDGIATAQALTASGGWMIFSFLWSEPVLLTVNLVVFASVFVFLIYNWAPAKIFMGDVGSLFLGFFFSVMPFLAASVSDEITIASSLWIGALLLWPFLFDSTYTILRRLIKGKYVFRAHRSHLYQRLYTSGWSHSKISILYLSFSLICLIFSLIYFYEADVIRLLILIMILLISYIHVNFVHQQEKVS